MAVQTKLELIGIQQRTTQLTSNYYNDSDVSNHYGPMHTRARSDQETPEAGKGTGIYMDTYNGGGSIDIYGSLNAVGSGRVGNLTFNDYNQTNGYETPNTASNVGQIRF